MDHPYFIRFNTQNGEPYVVVPLLAKYVSIISSDTIQGHTFGMTLVENFLASILLRKLKGSEEIEARQSLFSVKLYENLHIITVRFRVMPDKDDTIYYTLRRLKSFQL